jgi:hypothetical protein
MAENGLEDYPNLVTGASIPTQAPETAGAAKTVSVPIQEGAAGDTLPRPRRRKRLKAAPGSKLAFLEGVATDNVAAAGAIQINAPTSYGTGYIGPTEPTVVYSTNYNVSLPTADRVFKETDVIRKGCIRSEGIFLNSGEESVAPKRLESKSELELRFLVIGLFKGKNRIPDERLLRIKYPNWLFWQIWLDIIKLRGIGYFFSLKDVEGFRLYEVSTFNLPLPRIELVTDLSIVQLAK